MTLLSDDPAGGRAAFGIDVPSGDGHFSSGQNQIVSSDGVMSVSVSVSISICDALGRRELTDIFLVGSFFAAAAGTVAACIKRVFEQHSDVCCLQLSHGYVLGLVAHVQVLLPNGLLLQGSVQGSHHRQRQCASGSGSGSASGSGSGSAGSGSGSGLGSGSGSAGSASGSACFGPAFFFRLSFFTACRCQCQALRPLARQRPGVPALQPRRLVHSPQGFGSSYPGQ
ncbi:uncharacterized protein LOC123399081 isoform X1 [Hordeum vulgare subsp. vulgare]|uniref:uncharacterized protein LOC123399081 isoform X1 n=1 Tax=Hordeum vulgare subsp. vulgare TaxID=112509 RepID=UPI001D1A3DDA|nr:uncharacterized protein LOC123399081 isoform X1 [Hordeum vulgare subsp. vulgare]